MSLSWLCLLL